MDTRRVFDRVHGEVELPPLAAAICATEEFHRLDGVRQLGASALVYPSATHTRREHSIGVCHLAACVIRGLRQRQPSLGLDDDDVLCAHVAGLAHDLGHGPYSHLFEVFVAESGVPEWSHEDMGVLLLDRLTARLDLSAHFRCARSSLAMVKLMITGLDAGAPWPADEVGRPESKRFMADIVHDRATGIDVDKLDYLVRDATAVFGAARAINVDRLIASMRVVEHHGQPRLAFEESVTLDVEEVYALRTRLHRQVYQHRAVKVAESLVLDLMHAIDGGLPEGERLVDAGRDPARFVALVDATVTEPRPFATAERAALFTRPWFRRLPLAVHLETRPRCAECTAPTRVQDRFCGACGSPTGGRDHRVRKGMRTPAAAVLSEREATGAMRAALGRADVRVRISDVHHGVATGVPDPWDGVPWLCYDPLRTVLFCLRGGDGVVHHPCPPCADANRHIRVAYCYLPLSASEEEVAAATAIFQRWACPDLGYPLTIEASDEATPAVFGEVD